MEEREGDPFFRLTATTFEELDRERYIEDLPEAGWSSNFTSAQAIGVLRTLNNRLPGVAVPNVSPGPNGEIGLTLEFPRDYFSIVVLATGEVEVFHEDLETGEAWSEEGGEDELVAAIIERIRARI